VSALFVDPRIGREFQSAAEVESLPVGAVLIDSDGDAWQCARSGVWYGAFPGSSVGEVSSLLAEQFGPLLLVWIPPGSELKVEPEFEAVSAR
jgi:hypothetical protein